MRITSVKCYLCGACLPGGYQAGAAIIRVETDEDLCGHGESLMGLLCGEAAEAITRYYEPLLIGHDPAEIDAIWQRMFDSSVWWGRSGPAVSVMGAIESALWDIKGKLARKPCFKLIGDCPRTHVPVYASLGPSPHDPAAVNFLTDKIQSAGFRALKSGLQFGLMGRSGIYTPRGATLLRKLDKTLANIRQAVGDQFFIGVDGHMGGIPDAMQRNEALKVARVLEKYSVGFFEEPLSYFNPADYAWLRERTGVRIAGGESLSLVQGFQTFLDLEALDIVQPDANYVGGLNQAAKVILLAKRRRLRAMPHAWCAGPGIMANIHLAMAFASVERLEMGLCLTNLQEATLIEKPVIANGMLQAPTAPGLGIHFEPGMARHFPCHPGLAERASGLILCPLPVNPDRVNFSLAKKKHQILQ